MFRDIRYFIMALWALLVGYCTFWATHNLFAFEGFLADKWFTVSVVLGVLTIFNTFKLAKSWEKDSARSLLVTTFFVLVSAMGVLFFVIGPELFYAQYPFQAPLAETHMVLLVTLVAATVNSFGTILGLLILNFYEKFSSSYDKFFDFRTKGKP